MSLILELHKEKESLERKLQIITSTISMLGDSTPRKKKKQPRQGKKKTMSASARKKIAAAQKARWAKIKAAKG
jgi:hypothetical protein